MRDLLDTEQELTLHEQTLDDIYQRLWRNEEIVCLCDARVTLALTMNTPGQRHCNL